jgi:hypothetical protein
MEFTATIVFEYLPGSGAADLLLLSVGVNQKPTS